MTLPCPEATARLAYALWEHRGRAHGRDREDWLFAESLLSAALQPAAPRRRARATDPTLARPQAEARALALLEAAVARDGRAAVAARLGYASTATIGRLLRGERALSAELAARISGELGPPGRAAA